MQSIGQKKFAYKELFYALSQQTWAEEWNDDDRMWEKRGALYKLFNYCLPGKPQKDKKLEAHAVEVAGFVLRAGKQLDKIDTLFDMIVTQEYQSNDNEIEEIGLDIACIDKVLEMIIEFSLIQAELFKYDIHHKS